MASTTVRRTRRSARIDPDWSTTSAPTAAIGRRLGSVSVVSSPIFVEGGLWGTITVSAATRLPADTELRLQQFTEIVATAIADAQSRTTLRRLADEQAALRRVATLVAE